MATQIQSLPTIDKILKRDNKRDNRQYFENSGYAAMQIQSGQKLEVHDCMTMPHSLCETTQ